MNKPTFLASVWRCSTSLVFYNWTPPCWCMYLKLLCRVCRPHRKLVYSSLELWDSLKKSVKLFHLWDWIQITDLNRTYERSERLLAATCQLCVFVCSVEVLSAIHMQGKKCLCLQFAIQKFYYYSHLIIALTFKSWWTFYTNCLFSQLLLYFYIYCCILLGK